MLQTFICLSNTKLCNANKKKLHFGALLDKENPEANAYPYVHFTSKPLPLPLPS